MDRRLGSRRIVRTDGRNAVAAPDEGHRAAVANAKGAESEKTDAVSAAIDALNRAETIPDRYDAAQALNAAVEDLYSYGSNLKLSETDAGDFRYKYKNFSSALLRISHDSYNEQAASFNEEKRGFPAGLISALRGIGDAALYE